MQRAPRFAAITIMVILAACAADTGGGGATTGGEDGGDGSAAAGSTVDVTLQEWAVDVSATSVPAGDVTFAITNDGPDDIHEFVIFRTDLAVDALPTDENGVVDEGGEGITVVDEVEELEVGATAELTVALEPGTYALVCNVYDEEESEAHYQMGMRTAFTATE